MKRRKKIGKKKRRRMGKEKEWKGKSTQAEL